MKLLITAAAYVAALLVIAILAFCLLMALANSPDAAWVESHALGPGILLTFGWAAALLLPVFVARLVWRRLGRKGRG